MFPKKRHQQFDPTSTPASFDSLQVFQVSPPFRDQRITPRRDSLSLRWQLPSFATWVELQHDGGFGGNWTHTLAIRWGFGWGWKGQISPKKEDDKWGHTLGLKVLSTPILVPPKQNIIYVFSCWGCGEKHTFDRWQLHIFFGNFKARKLGKMIPIFDLRIFFQIGCGSTTNQGKFQPTWNADALFV